MWMHRILQGFAMLAKLYDGVVPVGTACSGSEMPAEVMCKLASWWEKAYLLKLNFSIKFSCDHKFASQQFILQNFRPEKFYDSLETMVSTSPVDMLSGKVIEPDRVAVLFVSPECDDYSDMNMNTVGEYSFFEEARGPSGRSANLVVRLFQKVQPPLSFIEQLKNWNRRTDKDKPSDYELFRHAFNTKCSIMLQDALIDSKCCLNPMSRNRMYTFGLKVGSNPHGFDQTSDDFRAPPQCLN
jgi:site-specific DNA-cytosine methylase